MNWSSPKIVFLLPDCLAFLPKTYMSWMAYASLVCRISWMIIYKTYRFYWVEPSGSRSKSYNHGFLSASAARISRMNSLFPCFITLCFWLQVRGVAGAHDTLPPSWNHRLFHLPLSPFGSSWRRCHFRLWFNGKLLYSSRMIYYLLSL